MHAACERNKACLATRDAVISGRLSPARRWYTGRRLAGTQSPSPQRDRMTFPPPDFPFLPLFPSLLSSLPSSLLCRPSLAPSSLGRTTVAHQPRVVINRIVSLSFCLKDRRNSWIASLTSESCLGCCWVPCSTRPSYTTRPPSPCVSRFLWRRTYTSLSTSR